MSPYVDSSGGEDTATNPVRAPTGVATTSSCYWQLHLTQSFDEPIDDTGSSKLRLRAALDSGPWYSNGHVELAAVRGGSRAHRHSYSQERASHEERRYQQFWARLWLSRNGFGQSFRTFALLVLPVVLLVGVGTYFRLIEADIETAWLVVGMNRLRHAYLELAPELEPYFVASHHDDAPGLLKTYSFRSRVGLTHWLSGSPVIVGIINAVGTGVLAAVICEAADAGATLRTITGVLAAVATAILLGIIGYRTVREVTGNYQPRFPS